MGLWAQPRSSPPPVAVVRPGPPGSKVGQGAQPVGSPPSAADCRGSSVGACGRGCDLRGGAGAAAAVASWATSPCGYSQTVKRPKGAIHCQKVTASSAGTVSQHHGSTGSYACCDGTTAETNDGSCLRGSGSCAAAGASVSCNPEEGSSFRVCAWVGSDSDRHAGRSLRPREYGGACVQMAPRPADQPQQPPSLGSASFSAAGALASSPQWMSVRHLRMLPSCSSVGRANTSCLVKAFEPSMEPPYGEVLSRTLACAALLHLASSLSATAPDQVAVVLVAQVQHAFDGQTAVG